MFQTMNVWVDNAPYVSGGVAETGAFLLLDVPPGNITVVFSTAGARPRSSFCRTSREMPMSSCLRFCCAVDSVALLDPRSVKVRLAGTVDHATPTGATARVAGAAVPIMTTPIREMSDRHDYPVRPAGARPLGISDKEKDMDRRTRNRGNFPSRFATVVTHWAGSTAGFILAVLVIVVWGATGPIFHWSDTWQLVHQHRHDHHSRF